MFPSRNGPPRRSAWSRPGSANWSNLAETASYENMMFVADGNIVRGYAADFEWMWRQAAWRLK